ncbi:ArdC family protein [Paludibaculum fermentans]|uniref:ArdC family protein n=1 Tax=Paludibaculum fermentans TaxID=1473598 RepID=UPI003EB77F37
MKPHEQPGCTPSVKRDHRQEVTDSIVKMLEDGVAPWQKPWESAGMPINPTTDKAYRGGNAIHLIATGLARGYEDPRWMTYKQAAEKGWQVRQGEKGTHVEFWEVKTRQEAKSPEPAKQGDEEQGKENRSRLIHRVYTVFNAKQIDGVPAFVRERPSTFEAVQRGEQILTNSGAKIAHDQRDHAFYRPTTDSIHLPAKEAFKDAPGYYGTALHELAHWTGHSSRLNRATLNDSYRFGDLNYAKEELRAELASVFIAVEVGLPHNPANHAAYVGSWIKALKEDKNEIFRAAHDASAAADFVLTLEREASRAESLEVSAAASTGIEAAQDVRNEVEILEQDRDLAGSRDAEASTVSAPAPLSDAERESTRFVARLESQSGTIAVRDKTQETDRHTPVEISSSQNGPIQAEGKTPGNHAHGGLSSSYASAKQIAVEKLGDSARTFTAQTESGNYRGEIIGETALHVIQRLSPQSAVAHRKHLLQSVPEVGENVGIAYANGLGSCKALRDKPRERELVR